MEKDTFVTVNLKTGEINLHDNLELNDKSIERLIKIKNLLKEGNSEIIPFIKKHY